MADNSQVLIHGQTAGYLSWDSNQQVAFFEFEKELSLPIAPFVQDKLQVITGIKGNTYKGLPAFLADSLPDNWGNRVIDLWLEAKGISRQNFSPVDRLCYIGKRGMGALEFQPVLSETIDKGEISIKDLIEVAEIAAGHKEKFTSSLENIAEVIHISSSAGGARAKAVLGINWQTGEIRSGMFGLPNGFEHCLLKLDGGEEKGWTKPAQYCRTEYAYYLMAKDAGIEMNECKLLHDGDRRHFCTKRFDRIHGKKVHMLTACGMFEMDFNRQQEYSYEDILVGMRRLKLPQIDMENLVRRAVFNVLTCNHDDHTKNFSFNMNNTGKWRLAPAYDLTYIHTSQGWNYGHQITINSKYENITTKDLEALGSFAECKNKVQGMIDQIQTITAKFSQYAKKAEMSKERIKKIKNAFKEINKIVH